MPKTLRIYEVQSHRGQQSEDREQLQLINRSRMGYEMKPYPFEQINQCNRKTDWERLLTLFESNLPVASLSLTFQSNRLRIWLATGRFIGPLANLMEEALELVPNNKPLTLEVLSKAFIQMHRTRYSVPPNPFSPELDEKDLLSWYESKMSNVQKGVS